jgi:hypothetical protein
VPVTPTAIRTEGADASFAYVWNGSAWVESRIVAGVLGVTATGAAGAVVTLTLPAPGAGLFHYVTWLQVLMYSTAARTGSATPVLVTSTNLPALTLTFPSAGAVGATVEQKTEPSAPSRSAVANTASTIVCPATTNVIWRINAHYYGGL